MEKKKTQQKNQNKPTNAWSAYHAVSVCYQQTNLIREGMTDFPLLKSLSCFDHCLICTHFTVQLCSLFFFPHFRMCIEVHRHLPCIQILIQIDHLGYKRTLPFFRIRFFLLPHTIKNVESLLHLFHETLYVKEQYFLSFFPRHEKIGFIFLLLNYLQN